MILKTCIMTNSTCYKGSSSSVKTGIVVHSTGANNPYIKRYVQPLETDADYETIIADIGVNMFGNDWNHAFRNGGVHAFIGKNIKDVVETYQVIPYELSAWGVGKGKNGSYNYEPTARIQFEICEDDLTDETYFNTAMKEAQEYCAYLCKQCNWGVDKICSHAEAHDAGYGNNHGDPDNWLKKYGKDMNWFRAEVKKLLEDDMAYEVHIDGKYEKIESANAMVALLGTIGVKATVVDTESVEPIPDEPTVKAGDKAMMEDGATWYTGKKPAAWVYKTVLTVLSVSNDAAVVSADGENYTGTACVKDLIVI